jgi:ATP-dependent RNA helicase RhlE
MSFTKFNFTTGLQEGLDAMGFHQPTPIQEMAIPAILDGKDLIACAQTGTGKTAAYVLPILHRIAESSHSHLNTLIIAPTRELAMQIDQQIDGFSYFLKVSSISIYGGGDGIAWEQQKRALKEGADIIIATPGRLISLLGGDDVDFSHLQHLVLDEADRMLDMGFFDDIIRIIRKLPAKRQTMLFSATMPPRIRTLATQILHEPEEVSISVSKPAEKIRQEFYFVEDGQKIPFVQQILSNPEYQSIIIFASTKESAKKVDAALHKINIPSKAFHSDLDQQAREELMRDFKSRRLRILVGTDVLSRGIDVDGISLVLNYDAPPDPEDYVHRIGRTARAERTGVAITFVNANDYRRFQKIERLLEKRIEPLPLPAEIGVSPDIRSTIPQKNRPAGKRYNKNKNSNHSSKK